MLLFRKITKSIIEKPTFALLILICLSCQTQNDQSEAADFFLRGNLLVQNKEFEKAVKMYNEALEKKPDFVDALNNKGMAYLKLNNAEEALIAFEKALSIEPNYTPALFNRSEALFLSKDYKQCISDLEEVKKTYKDTFYVYTSLGNAFVKLNQQNLAFENYNKAIALNPKSEESYINRGVLNFEKNNLEAAIKDYKKAIELNPNNANALNNLGLALIKIKDYNNALLVIDKSLTFDAGNPFYINNKAFLMLKLNKNDEAQKLAEKSLRIDDTNPYAYRNLGIAFFNKKDFKNAKLNLEKALALKSDIEETREYLK